LNLDLERAVRILAAGAAASAIVVGLGAAAPALADESSAPALPPTEYAFGTLASQRLDLYAQPGLKIAPMLLYVHGGAFTLFDKSDVDALPGFARRHGFLLASTNYRLGAGADKAAEDVAGAAAWMLREGRRFGGDPKRLFLMGWSSGGNTVGLVSIDPQYLAPYGRSPADIAGVIGVDGAGYNAASQIHSLFVILRPPILAMWVVAFGDHAAALSPTLLVRKGGHYPPFLLFYTNHPGGRSYTEEFAGKLRETGDQVAVVGAPDRIHITINSSLGEARDPYGDRAARFIATGKP
jgi:acetyl esterase/lipase